MINDQDLIVLLCWTSGLLLTTTITFATLWLRTRERALRYTLDQVRRPEDRDDMQHLVHAIDSIAVEVERISEGQRFTTQVLAERMPNASQQSKRVSSPERVITPH